MDNTGTSEHFSRKWDGTITERLWACSIEDADGNELSYEVRRTKDEARAAAWDALERDVAPPVDRARVLKGGRVGMRCKGQVKIARGTYNQCVNKAFTGGFCRLHGAKAPPERMATVYACADGEIHRAEAERRPTTWMLPADAPLAFGAKRILPLDAAHTDPAHAVRAAIEDCEKRIAHHREQADHYERLAAKYRELA